MTMTYKEQLLHPNWQRKRLEILARDDFTCCTCGATEKTLHVHHLRYVRGRMAWDYDNDDLTTCCEDCHAQAHRDRELLAAEVQRIDPSSTGRMVGLLVGLRNGITAGEGVEPDWVDAEIPNTDDARHGLVVGYLAHSLLDNATTEEVSALLKRVRAGELDG